MADSPFRQVPSSEWIGSNRSAFSFFDAYPVSEGHALVVPFREIGSWWEAERVEQIDLMDLVREVKFALDQRFHPSGYNVGFNSGAAAGQTIEHFHIHLIPRYEGDVTDPRGGIRHVIPGRGNYLEELLNPAAGVDVPQLLDGNTVDGMLRSKLDRCLDNEDFDRIDLVVSFIQISGLNIILPKIRDAIDRGAAVRILTTDYMDITDPDALSDLLDLSDELQTDRYRLGLKLWKASGQSFHPKAYLFYDSRSASSQGFVGSSNLSKSGIDGGVEWNLGTRAVKQLLKSFETLWTDPRAIDLSHEILRDYRSRRIVINVASDGDPTGVPQEEPREPVSPTPIQVEALEALEQTRSEGFSAGLVVMATGLGKTWLAAFDSARQGFQRTLFVAHREEILSQSRDVFRQVLPSADLGLYYGKEKSPDADVVFASVQTLTNHLGDFSPSQFDYIVVDEFHHASASSYRKIIEYFQPKFLLGLTATPDRLDGADLLALCADNLVFECNLVEGIDRGELVPFQYQGLRDLVDFAPIPWKNGKFDPEALTAAVETTDRAEQSLEAWREHGGGPTLGFCVSITHAEFMAKYFRTAGLRAVAVHSGAGSAPRLTSITGLRSRDLDIIFTVDLFNEGLDVPEIETVMMLRPTESPVVFLQQLGRGLRKSAGKSHLRVVDFIGNHRSFLMKPRTLLSLGGRSLATTKELVEAAGSGAFDLPEGCAVAYELEAVDLLASLVPKASKTDALADFCRGFQADYGRRPSALQALRAQLNPSAAKRLHGSWFGLLRDLDLLGDEEVHVVSQCGGILDQFIREEATKSYKLVTLKALIEKGMLREAVDSNELCLWARDRVFDDPRLIRDLSSSEMGDLISVSDRAWIDYWTKWPIDHLAGTKPGALFHRQGNEFKPTFSVPAELGSSFDAMVAEIVEWRLAEYLLRPSVSDLGSEVRCRLSHSNGNPILRLDRARHPELPWGEAIVSVDDESITLNFVKVAVNTARREGEVGNALHSLLRGWFGPSAGWPGTRQEVVLQDTPSGWTLRPAQRSPWSGEAVPLFPSFEVACGSATATEPATEGAMIELRAGEAAPIGPERQFVVFANGESMAGGRDPIHHGDALLFEWVRDAGRADLVGSRVLVQQREGRLVKPYLKRLERTDSGFQLASDNPAELPIPGASDMQVVARLRSVLHQEAVNPMSHLIGLQYTKKQAAELYGGTYTMGPWVMYGHVSHGSDEILFVTLDKQGMSDTAQYEDYFESGDRFVWSSQNQTSPESNQGQKVLASPGNGRMVHLWVRRTKQDLFTYCGIIFPLVHRGTKPMSVTFRLMDPLTQEMANLFLPQPN